MDKAEFDRNVQSLVTEIVQKDHSLYQEASRWWRHIHSGYFDFDFGTPPPSCHLSHVVPQHVALLNQLTHHDMVEFYSEHVKATAPNRRKLSIHIRATCKPDIATALSKSSLKDTVVLFEPPQILDIKKR